MAVILRYFTEIWAFEGQCVAVVGGWLILSVRNKNAAQGGMYRP